MGDVEPTEVAPSSKVDVQISNVGTSSKNKGKSKEIASSLKDKSVSTEGVESTKVSPTSKDREASSTTPSVEEIKKWKRADVMNFLREKQEDLDLDDEDIEIIRKNKVAGQAFLLLTEENLIQDGLPRGPAKSIAYLIETLKGGK
ncbi:hypothetical protein RhiirA4_121346 [Rhizophagus irregularis]|uniref:Uncharacterized protein n=1 Tax=Rhizophagus irregularis TaxID=588596 RepID=A0A2I1GAC3_9GLOM|nr:hypothetical protein RhiirA4_121346 [Rhizophagus irregularis]